MLHFVADYIDNDSEQAFVENLYKYMPFLRNRVYRSIKDINICNELAHDCMINIIKHLDKVKSLSDDKIRAYISVSIDNTVKNYLRRSSYRLGNKIFIPDSNYYLSKSLSVEAETKQKYDFETIKAGFDNLRECDKSVIIMKYYLELNDSQIADVLDIKKDSVRMTVLRSVKRLKKQIINQKNTVF